MKRRVQQASLIVVASGAPYERCAMEGLENVFKGDVTLRQAFGKNFQMFSSPLGDFCFFLPGGGEELWVHHGYGFGRLVG